MSKSEKTAEVHLEDQYHPLGIKAVQAAAELSSDHLDAVKEKPKKKKSVTEFTD